MSIFNTGAEGGQVSKRIAPFATKSGEVLRRPSLLRRFGSASPRSASARIPRNSPTAFLNGSPSSPKNPLCLPRRSFNLPHPPTPSLREGETSPDLVAQGCSETLLLETGLQPLSPLPGESENIGFAHVLAVCLYGTDRAPLALSLPGSTPQPPFQGGLLKEAIL